MSDEGQSAMMVLCFRCTQTVSKLMGPAGSTIVEEGTCAACGVPLGSAMYAGGYSVPVAEVVALLVTKARVRDETEARGIRWARVEEDE